MPDGTKRRLSDRRDGRRVRDLDPIHSFMPYLMPNRADCEAFISEQIDLSETLRYLERKNEGKADDRYTFFHVIAAALVKTLTLRPKMNRFIAGKRYYQRDEVTIGFVAKKRFDDDGHESLLLLTFDGTATVDSVHDAILSRVNGARSGAHSSTGDVLDVAAKLPRFLLRIVMAVFRFLDYYGRLPASIVADDPDYASVFLSNLGSIKLNAAYHHLNNWGTNSVFVVIGEKHRAPVLEPDGSAVIRDVLDIGITLDERLADGYYYAKTVRLFKHLMRHPELLEQRADAPVEYD